MLINWCGKTMSCSCEISVQMLHTQQLLISQLCFASNQRQCPLRMGWPRDMNSSNHCLRLVWPLSESQHNCFWKASWSNTSAGVSAVSSACHHGANLNEAEALLPNSVPVQYNQGPPLAQVCPGPFQLWIFKLVCRASLTQELSKLLPWNFHKTLYLA